MPLNKLLTPLGNPKMEVKRLCSVNVPKLENNILLEPIYSFKDQTDMYLTSNRNRLAVLHSQRRAEDTGYIEADIRMINKKPKPKREV
jgi:hypothetical protein